MKNFYSVELNKDNAEKLKEYLKLNGIYFEPSACYNLIHFEVKVDEAELETLKTRAAYYGLDKTENFEEYKTKYLQTATG